MVAHVIQATNFCACISEFYTSTGKESVYIMLAVVFLVNTSVAGSVKIWGSVGLRDSMTYH